MSAGQTTSSMTTGETTTTMGLQPYLLSTTQTAGLIPYLLTTLNTTKEPVSTTTAAPTEPPPELPDVPDYEPSSPAEPLKHCRCRTGVTTTPVPTTSGLVPYLLTSNKPTTGLLPLLLTTRPPNLLTTSSPFGFTGITSRSPTKFLRRRGQLLNMFL